MRCDPGRGKCCWREDRAGGDVELPCGIRRFILAGNASGDSELVALGGGIECWIVRTNDVWNGGLRFDHGLVIEVFGNADEPSGCRTNLEHDASRDELSNQRRVGAERRTMPHTR